MLLQFRVSNFRSFKHEVRLSTVGTRLDKGTGVQARIANDGTTVDVLPVVGILGANASGKSNLLLAMDRMRELVLTSGTRAPHLGISGDPFLLDPAWAKKPTLMEVDFTYLGARYQYGFEIYQGRVAEEWLHTFPHKRVQVLFDRENTTEFTFGKNLTGRNKVIADITRPQSLFLSTAAGANHPLLSEIYQFFVKNLRLLDVPDRARADADLVRRLAERRDQAVRLLAIADLGIVDANIDQGGERSVEEIERLRETVRDFFNFPDGMSESEREAQINEVIRDMAPIEPTVELVHRGAVRSGVGRAAVLPFESESLGTKSWLSFVVHALEALERGGVLLVDELDASLHPLLLAEALRMFQSRKSNRHGAQLIFTTHDVTLLGGARDTLDQYRLSRGQIWLVEKETDGGSTLTPLSDYKPRKGEDIARGYLQGRYGGTPKVGSGSLGLASSEDDLRALTRGDAIHHG